MPAASYLPADDVDVRRRLIDQIHDECVWASDPARSAQDGPNVMKQAIFWSVLQILDVATLGSVLKQLQEDHENEVDITERSTTYMATNAGRMARIFLATPQEDKESKYTRSAVEADKARLRDNNRCIITGWPECVEVCHIFPFDAINRKQKTSDALKDMSVMWGGPRVTSLRQRLVYPQQIIDTPANMVCMGRAACEMWSQGTFALEPLGVITEDDEKKKDEDAQDDDTQEKDEVVRGVAETSGTGPRGSKRKRPTPMRYGIKLRFHWLRRTTLQSPAQTVNFAEHPSNIWRPEDMEPRRCLLDINGRPIDDGHIIKIYSYNNRDELPDLEILRLRWDIYRMTALCGRADPTEYVRAFPFNDEEEEWPAVPAGPTSSQLCVRCGAGLAAR